MDGSRVRRQKEGVNSIYASKLLINALLHIKKVSKQHAISELFILKTGFHVAGCSPVISLIFSIPCNIRAPLHSISAN